MGKVNKYFILLNSNNLINLMLLDYYHTSVNDNIITVHLQTSGQIGVFAETSESVICPDHRHVI